MNKKTFLNLVEDLDGSYYSIMAAEASKEILLLSQKEDTVSTQVIQKIYIKMGESPLSVKKRILTLKNNYISWLKEYAKGKNIIVL